MDELHRHNGALVRTAHDLRRMLQQALTTMESALGAAVPVAEQHEEHPSEYMLPAEDIDEMRSIITVIKAWREAK